MRVWSPHALQCFKASIRDVVIGSYPYIVNDKFATNIVLRCRDRSCLDAAVVAVEAMVADLKDKDQKQF